MRILLHDFGCYAFIIPLARWLAEQGHQVLHLSAEELVGPRGTAIRHAGDPAGLTFDRVRLGRPFTRYALPRRLLDEYRYGRGLARKIGEFRPDLILSANTPPLAQAVAFRHARRRAIPCVAWVQDIFSLGAAPMVARLPKPVAALALAALRRLEFGTLSQSAGLIVIAPAFLASLEAHGIRHPMTLIQENWAASAQGTLERQKVWAEAQGFGGDKVILAAGTLGRKHDPELLARLATELTKDPETRLIIVSEGPGRDYLEKLKTATLLPNLILLDYQPSAQVPAMLASADIGLVQLNAVANDMSIPSKVYSYAAAGLPILAAIPQTNHAARLIREHGLGLVVEPDDYHGFLAAARRLLEDTSFRHTCGAAGLVYTAQHGNIALIGGRVMAFLETVKGGGAPTRGAEI